MIYSAANFFRTDTNSNCAITLPAGTDIISDEIWYSEPADLPAGVFNVIDQDARIEFVDGHEALIGTDITAQHNVIIHYKLTKGDNTDYVNNREVRCALVNAGDVIYNDSLYASYQARSNAHNYILLRGHHTHSFGDVVRIQFNVVQDSSDVSDTCITVFRVSWNISGLI